MGLGMVLRDDAGCFLDCSTLKFEGFYNVKEGEAMGLPEALSWVKNMGYQKVVYELDAKMVVYAVHFAAFFPFLWHFRFVSFWVFVNF